MTQSYALPELPYALDALEPHMSRETLEFHHGKHHATYVKKLNELIKESELDGQPLEEVIRRSSGSLFNNAAQAWNHAFFWRCLTPDGGGAADRELGQAILDQFGSFGDFRERFTQVSTALFGSGWAWLTLRDDGSLDIEGRGNADTPIRDGGTPLLTCDLWEHAYYIDYRNSRPKYLEAFWQIANWRFANERFLEAKQGGQRRAAS
ncbi:MAG: superoxide dismutase [Thiohalobacteraceae bacterium]